MLHGAGIFTNIYPINDPNVGKYTSTMVRIWDQSLLKPHEDNKRQPLIERPAVILAPVPCQFCRRARKPKKASAAQMSNDILTSDG